MITVCMSAVIGAGRDRVWRAITSPDELLAWNEHLLAAIDEPGDYPCEGQQLRWRYRLGSVQTVLREHTRSVEPLCRMAASIALGSLHFEQTFTLHGARQNGHARTQLGMKVVARNRLPLLSDMVDRFGVRQVVSDHVDETLSGLRRWCEREA